MGVPGFLAVRAMRRNAVRTALVIAGLSVTGALLLDMTMLSGGLQASLGQVLGRLGFAIRVVPRGTMPFSGGAGIPGGMALARAIAARPGVTSAVPILATNLYARRGRRAFATFAMGVPRGGTGAYGVVRGRDLPGVRGADPADRAGADEAGPGFSAAGTPPPAVVNENMAALDGVRIGDTIDLSAAPRPALAGFTSAARFRVVGIADFYFDLAAQRSVALRDADLRRLAGAPAGTASLILVRVADPACVEPVARWIGDRDPQVDALSIPRFLDRAGSRLTYFNQFSLILSTLSMAVAFLLVTSIVTLSLGERLGEIAMLRALGLTRRRIGALVLLEGVLLSAASLPGAFALGLALSGYLDGILRAAPGVPENLHFFTLTAAAVWHTVALVLGVGTLAGLYPAAVAARLGIASTLHGEVMS